MHYGGGNRYDTIPAEAESRVGQRSRLSEGRKPNKNGELCKFCDPERLTLNQCLRDGLDLRDMRGGGVRADWPTHRSAVPSLAHVR